MPSHRDNGDIHIRRSGLDLTADAGAYRFEFSGRDAGGRLFDAYCPQPVLTMSFVPAVNGQMMADFTVTGVEVSARTATVACRAGGVSLALSINFTPCGLVYSYSFDAAGLAKLELGGIEGQFFQVCNFGADLSRMDLPATAAMDLQVSSRRVQYDKFFQLDGGNFMMPPYLLAFFDRRRYVGLGLLGVSDAANALDVRASAGHLGVSFDYARGPKSGRYDSPPLLICLADSPVGILQAYRDSLPPAPPRTAEQAWWRRAIYTTWGDQVYRKHIAEGRFQAEAGAEKHLSAEMIDAALAELASHDIRPGTIVIDEGWSRSLGDWDADDAKFAGSLRQYIRHKQAEGYRIVLHFNPFLVDAASSLAVGHPQFLVADTAGKPCKVARSGRDYCLFDWSRPDVREHLCRKIAAMVAPAALGADGIKLSGVKFLSDPADVLAERAYGVGERYLLAVLEDISRAVKQAAPEATIFLACLNPLFSHCFDIVRLGNTSEVNHDLYVQRAATASWLLPGRPIDTDDWACYAKVLGATTFIKALAGVPNIFSAFYRGDGRLKVQGAAGGSPIRMSAEQYRVISAAWKMHEFSRDIDRSNLRVDYDRMEFSTPPAVDGQPFARTYQGGNTLAVYRGRDIHLASLLEAKLIIDLPDGFEPIRVERVDRAGTRQKVDFRKCLGNKIVFDAQSSRDEAYYYHIQGAQ
ncbi:MAG: alpha-galactosidase [Phycisphaerae bacterium]|jgi:hypothetical protein